MKISTILDQIDLGSMALPEFQRGYVWNRNQVKDLITSLYKRHPVGGLLVWVTKTEQAKSRGDQALQPGSVRLILDGQQRITSLYGIVKGRTPPFFDGSASAFSGLYFNLDTEIFEFYGPVKMRDNPYWIDVTQLMCSGLEPFIGYIQGSDELRGSMGTYIARLNTILGIRDVDLYIDDVTGDDKTVDVVVDIFNKVNSGGTKLSKGDLALARICAEWPDARDALRKNLKRWQSTGYYFKIDWLLRNVNTVVTGEALFSALKDVSAVQFQTGLQQSVAAIDYLLNIVSSRLGLDHDRVLGGRYSFPVMARYLAQRGGKFHSALERDRFLYWYVHSLLWGRFAGSTESTLNQDLGAMEESDDPIGALIEQLRLWRGDLSIRPEDFRGWSLGARFYPMLYLLTRIGNAQDWCSGIPLNAHLLGRLSRLQVHHIFPRALLYQQGIGRAEVNALANFCFQPQDCNLAISDMRPEVYFPQVENAYPGALASQWIPMDSSLWRVDRYPQFLEARQELLAQAANRFLNSLLIGTVPESTTLAEAKVPTTGEVIVRGGLDGDDEEGLLLECNLWVVEQGLPEGELLYEVTDETTGEPLVVIDLAWPNGLQEGLSQPVALLIDEQPETEEIVNSLGYRYFIDIDEFISYVRQDILALKPDELIDEDLSLAQQVKEEDVQRMLTRLTISKGQMALYRVLFAAEGRSLTYTDLATAMDRTPQELAGVLGGLGARINKTEGLKGKGGISTILETTPNASGEWTYRMRPVLRRALETEGIL